MDKGIGNISKAIKLFSGLWENIVIIFNTGMTYAISSELH